MKYDFDTVIDRRGTWSAKWEGWRAHPDYQAPFTERTIPMMVADMDLKTAPAIIEEMHRVADFGMWGYTSENASPEYARAVCGWYARRHNWHFAPEAVQHINGTVAAIGVALKAFTAPGDSIVICRPVYGHFTSYIQDQGRRVESVHLIDDGTGYYTMDFDGIDKAMAKEENKIFLLCNPANPAGRVWTEEELRTLSEICKKHDKLLISDEVHCDIVRTGLQYVPMGRVAAEGTKLIVVTGVNKTFNLAGLFCSQAIIPDKALREAYQAHIGEYQPTPFAVAACIKAYGGECDDWVDALNEYLDGNIDFALAHMKVHLPNARCRRPEGTYTLWIDFSGYGLSDEEVHRRIYSPEGADVRLQDGLVHDPDQGACFQRMCVSCARSVVKEALERIAAQFEG